MGEHPHTISFPHFPPTLISCIEKVFNCSIKLWQAGVRMIQLENTEHYQERLLVGYRPLQQVQVLHDLGGHLLVQFPDICKVCDLSLALLVCAQHINLVTFSSSHVSDTALEKAWDASPGRKNLVTFS